MKLKFYKPVIPYQPNEKYILDVQNKFININGEPRLTQLICSIQIPTYTTIDYPKLLKVMLPVDLDYNYNYMTGSYYITPHLTAKPAPTVFLTATSNSILLGHELDLLPIFGNLSGGTANIISDISNNYFLTTQIRLTPQYTPNTAMNTVDFGIQVKTAATGTNNDICVAAVTPDIPMNIIKKV